MAAVTVASLALSLTLVEELPAQADSNSYTPGPSPTTTCAMLLCGGAMYPTGDDATTTRSDLAVDIDVMANDCHSNLGPQIVTFGISTPVDPTQPGVTAGSVTVSPDNHLIFTPDPAFTGIAQFSYYWIESGLELSTTGSQVQNTRYSAGFEYGPPAFVTVNVNRSDLNTGYVALGDSYSSGEGSPPFLPGTDGPTDYCHRSTKAYPYLLSNHYDQALQFFACGDATTGAMTSRYHYTEQPQLSHSEVNSRVALATLTVGGNDAGFAGTLTSCIEQRIENSFLSVIASWLGFRAGDPSCAHSNSFVNSVNSNIDGVADSVKGTYQQLLSQVSPTDTSVIVADYPRIFPTSHAEQTCIQLSPYLTTDDQDFLNTSGDRLDDVLETAARQAGVNFVDVRSIFDGHAICANSGAWINSVSTASGGAGNLLPLAGSFHPSAAGHSQGYAQAIEDYINSASAVTPEGFPANPFPMPNASINPTSTSTPMDSIHDLTVVPVVPTSTNCRGFYRPGERLAVTGDGFAPHAAVQIYVSSPGVGLLGLSQQQLLTGLRADSTGSISATVTVPATATGFQQPGSSSGIAFIDAIGYGVGGTHADDVAMIGISPH